MRYDNWMHPIAQKTGSGLIFTVGATQYNKEETDE